MDNAIAALQADPEYKRACRVSQEISHKAVEHAASVYENECATEKARHEVALRKIRQRYDARLTGARETHKNTINRAAEAAMKRAGPDE